MIGKIGASPDSVVAIPGADDTEGWKAFYAKLGRPESADKYTLPNVKLPEGLVVDDALRANFTARAHDLNLTNKQAEGLYEWWNSQMGSAHTTTSQAKAVATQQALDGLKTEWGQAFESKLTEAKAAVAHYGDADLVAYLNDTGLGDDPRLIKTFAKLGAQLREDGLVGRGDTGGRDGVLSPTEARQQIAHLRGDEAFKKDYMNAKAPGHKAAMERMTRLHQMAHPG